LAKEGTTLRRTVVRPWRGRLKRFLHLPPKALTSGGQPDAPAVALKDGSTKPSFNDSNPAADRTMRDPQRLRSMGQ
jgi:hypothetical protein